MTPNCWWVWHVYRFVICAVDVLAVGLVCLDLPYLKALTQILITAQQ